jgi:hypothetical protein
MIFAADNPQAAFLRHFSVILGGIKTYPARPIKMLFATLGSLNTDAGFTRRYPQSSPFNHKT